MFKKYSIVLVGFWALLGSPSFALENAQNTSFFQAEKNPHNVRVGVDLFGLHLKTHVKDIQMRGDKFFWGFRFGYDYLKPEAFYAGIDILTASGENNFKASSHGDRISQRSDDTWFGSSELRLGYTCAPKKWLCSPFLGIGGYMVEPLFHSQGFKERLPYIAVGIRSIYECSSVFNVGINFKVFHTVAAKEKYKQYHGSSYTRHPSFFGAEFGVPLQWFLGLKKRWNVQLEPYFLQLTFSEAQTAYGMNASLGYRF